MVELIQQRSGVVAGLWRGLVVRDGLAPTLQVPSHLNSGSGGQHRAVLDILIPSLTEFKALMTLGSLLKSSLWFRPFFCQMVLLIVIVSESARLLDNPFYISPFFLFFNDFMADGLWV